MGIIRVDCMLKIHLFCIIYHLFKHHEELKQKNFTYVN